MIRCDPDAPAYPLSNHHEGAPRSDEEGQQYSLTKREYFASQCLSGLLADKTKPPDKRYIAMVAVEMADNLITALNKGRT